MISKQNKPVTCVRSNSFDSFYFDRYPLALQLEVPKGSVNKRTLTTWTWTIKDYKQSVMVLYLNFLGNKCRYNQCVLSSTNSVCSLTLVIWSPRCIPVLLLFWSRNPAPQLIHILVRRCCYEAVQLFSRVLHGVLMAGSPAETSLWWLQSNMRNDEMSFCWLGWVTFDGQNPLKSCTSGMNMYTNMRS